MLISFETLDRLNLKIKGVIHIGGHTGEEIPFYLDRGWRVAIFEPYKETFDQIVESEFVKKYNVALGPKKDMVKLNIASNYASSSILKPKLHLYEHPHVNFNSVIEVPQETLDSYSFYEYNMLNIDVQGYELEVLRGSVETFKHIDCIYIEVNDRELYENCVLLKELDYWLSKHNFYRTITEMTRHGWGDAIYIKK